MYFCLVKLVNNPILSCLKVTLWLLNNLHFPLDGPNLLNYHTLLALNFDRRPYEIIHILRILVLLMIKLLFLFCLLFIYQLLKILFIFYLLKNRRQSQLFRLSVINIYIVNYFEVRIIAIKLAVKLAIHVIFFVFIDLKLVQSLLLSLDKVKMSLILLL